MLLAPTRHCFLRNDLFLEYTPSPRSIAVDPQEWARFVISLLLDDSPRLAGDNRALQTGREGGCGCTGKAVKGVGGVGEVGEGWEAQVSPSLTMRWAGLRAS